MVEAVECDPRSRRGSEANAVEEDAAVVCTVEPRRPWQAAAGACEAPVEVVRVARTTRKEEAAGAAAVDVALLPAVVDELVACELRCKELE